MFRRMPILDGFQATRQIRAIERRSPRTSPSSTIPPNATLESDSASTSLSVANPLRVSRTSKLLNGRVPIFVVSASLLERKRDDLIALGIDGWILKPIDFKRLREFLQGILDLEQRKRDLYRHGCSWEAGGWLADGTRV